MRFSKFFVAALAPVGLFAKDAPADLSTPELINLLEQHDLAIVPKSELTGALTELTAFLKSERNQPRYAAPRVIKRQRPAGNMTTGSGSDAADNAEHAADPDSPIDLPSPKDFGDDLGGMFKGVTEQLADLPGLLRAVQGLLTDDFLDGFRKSMIYLSASLEPPIPNILQNLLKKVAPLMDKADPLFGLIEELDVQALVDKVKDVDFNKILGTVFDLVGRIGPLLDEIDIEGLVKQINPLLQQAGPLLKQVGPLLGEVSKIDLVGLVKQITPLLNTVGEIDIQGLLKQVEPLLKQAGPLLGEISKIDLVKLISKVTPLLDMASDIDIEGLIEQVDPLLKQAGPLLGEISKIDLVKLIQKITPILDMVSEIDIQGLLKQVDPLLKQVGPLLGEVSKIDLVGIIDAVTPLLEAVKQVDVEEVVKNALPLLEPDSIKMLVGLVRNAGDLLTKKFVGQTSELIGDATPLVASAADLVHDLLKGLTGKKDKR